MRWRDRNRWLALRTRNYKYVLYAANGGKEELYDLRKDPGETSNIADDNPERLSDFREEVLEWEMKYGLEDSFADGEFRTYPGPDRVPDEEECRGVNINEGPWPNCLPEDEKDAVESFAEAFTKAIRKEKTVSPEKLSVGEYKKKIEDTAPEDRGGGSLVGSSWEDVWNSL